MEQPSLAARFLEKKTRIFLFFSCPPVPVSPGLPEDDPTIDKNKRPGFNWVDCTFEPGLPEKRQARAG